MIEYPKTDDLNFRLRNEKEQNKLKIYRRARITNLHTETDLIKCQRGNQLSRKLVHFLKSQQN